MNQPGNAVAAVLRERLNAPPMRIFAAEVSAIPDASHVTLDMDGELVTVPHLESYSPIVGDSACVHAQGSFVIVVGAVR